MKVKSLDSPANRSLLFNIVKKIFDRFFWGQHPETATRYFPVVAQIKKANLKNPRILEVGSGSLGVVPYLKKEIDGLDINFSGPQSPLLNKIKGKATDLPFRKNSYDVVISVDLLEHLSKDEREKAVFEMIRVAKNLAIIVVPTGELSQKQDRQLDKYYQKVFGTRNQFLKEHVQNGLPKTEEILVFIDRSLRGLKKQAKVTSDRKSVV